MAPESDTSPEGGPRVFEIPEGDNRERLVCPDCGFINYENPKIVVGAVVGYGGKIMLCRRDINPRRGFWTIPAGFLELNETVVDGARREAREEACAEIEMIAFSGFITCRGSARCRSSIARACRHRISASVRKPRKWPCFLGRRPVGEIAFPSVQGAQ